MARKNVLKRSMFQMGGAAFGEPPLPTAPPMGGGIVEGLGLNAPDPMPTAPPTPSPAEQQAISGGIESLTGMLGQIEGADDTQSLINAMRGDEKTVDERYTELAKYVGREDATATPESVLTLVQPTFELLDQAETGGGLGMPSDMLEPSAPPPVEETMSLTETETITEPVQGFQWGGFAAKKPNTPVYRQNGSPIWGEIETQYLPAPGVMSGESVLRTAEDLISSNPYTQGQRTPQNVAGIINPYGVTPAALSPAQQARLQSARDTPFTHQLMEQKKAWEDYRRGVYPDEAMYADRPAVKDIQKRQRDINAQTLASAEFGSEIRSLLNEPETAQEIYARRLGMIDEDEDLLATEDEDVIQKRIEALLKPSELEPKTKEEFLEEAVQLPEDKGRAAFALAKYFSQVAQEPGTVLQSLTAPVGELTDTLSEMGREREVMEFQQEQQALDAFRANKENIRQDQRARALAVLQEVQANRLGNRGFMQQQFAASVAEAMQQADTKLKGEMAIAEQRMEFGLTADPESDALIADLYEDVGKIDKGPDGREWKTVITKDGTGTEKVLVGFAGETFDDVNLRRYNLTGAEANWVPPEGVTFDANGNPDYTNTAPIVVLDSLSDTQVNKLRNDMIALDNAIFKGAAILDEALVLEATGPLNVAKAFASGTLGAFGVKWAQWIKIPENQKRLEDWAREYTRANALSERYAVAEQNIIKEMLAQDPKFFEDADASYGIMKMFMTQLINDYEIDKSILERRPPASLATDMQSGTRKDPLDWDDLRNQRLVGLAGEQGVEAFWHVDMSGQQATVAQFAEPKYDRRGRLIGQETYEEIIQRDPSKDIYKQWIENNNRIPMKITLARPDPNSSSQPTFETLGPPILPASTTQQWAERMKPTHDDPFGMGIN